MSNRELSSIEKFFFFRRKLKLHSCFYLAVKLNDYVEEGCISRALKKTIKQFPQLYSNVFTRGDKAILEPIRATIHFRDVVSFEIQDELSEEFVNKIFRSVKFKYNTNEVLWKLVALRDKQTFIFCVDHVLFDGMSTVKFWEAFVGALNEDEEDKTSEIVYSPSDEVSTIPSHPYDLLPISFKWKLIRSLVRLLLLLNVFPYQQELSNKQIKFKGYQYPHGLLNNDQKTRHIRNDNCQMNVHISTEDLKNLLAGCKAHKVTLTSFMMSAVIRSLDALDPSYFTGSEMKINFPINTRSSMENELHLEPNSLQMGNFIKSEEVKYEINPSKNLWDIAKEINKTVFAKRSESDSINKIRLLDIVDNERYILGKTQAHFPSSTFEVTNLGFQSFKNSVHNRYYIVDAQFNQPQGISDIFTCSLISTVVGGIELLYQLPERSI